MSLPNDWCAFDMLIMLVSDSLAYLVETKWVGFVIDLLTQPEVRTLSIGTSCVGYNYLLRWSSLFDVWTFCECLAIFITLD